MERLATFSIERYCLRYVISIMMVMFLFQRRKRVQVVSRRVVQTLRRDKQVFCSFRVEPQQDRAVVEAAFRKGRGQTGHLGR
jgi:hypothetical protein